MDSCKEFHGRDCTNPRADGRAPRGLGARSACATDRAAAVARGGAENEQHGHRRCAERRLRHTDSPALFMPTGASSFTSWYVMCMCICVCVCVCVCRHADSRVGMPPHPHADAHGIRVRPACALAGARALVPCCMRSDARTTARPTMHARAMRTRPPARPPARPHLVSLSRIDRAVLQLRKVPGSGLARSLFASSPPSLPLLPSSLLLFSGPGGGPRAGAPKTSRELPGRLPGSLPFSNKRADLIQGGGVGGGVGRW